jgi:nucleotide-binding universal stress UspA family protein
MYQTLVVPLDGSGSCEDALAVALEQFNDGQIPIILLRVVPRPEVPCPDHRVRFSGPAIRSVPCDEERIAGELREARSYLKQVAARHGLPADTTIRVTVGDPASRIVDEASQLPDPLVVMTTSGDRHERRRVPGDVPLRVLASGRASVLGIPGRPAKLRAEIQDLCKFSTTPSPVHFSAASRTDLGLRRRLRTS